MGAILAAALVAVGVATATPLRLAVPVVRQAPERCGPAALGMVLRFYGAGAPALAEADRAYDPVLRGALITDLAAAARRAGFAAAVGSPSDDSLVALLRAGVPPVLLTRRGLGPVSRGHYVVLVGFDPARDRFEILDGGASARTLGRASLLKPWRAAGGQALIVRRDTSS